MRRRNFEPFSTPKGTHRATLPKGSTVLFEPVLTFPGRPTGTSLGGKDSDTYRNVPFDGKKYAEVYVEAAGNQDLNVFIYDAQNRLVCSDTDSSAIAYCGWRPRESGQFSLKITNESGGSAQYSLMTN